ncbi:MULTISPECIES: hypothetical protein [Hyphomicrobiales]|uniref:hypothetical protein n=1 Tax=Hyphomicrobiales TaxID=356 RepID=UPI000DC01FB3|nr:MULTISPECIES: hypothetical protein [Hyphomicrobiales]KAB2695403.1 hypothetical protein F9K79_19030 [Ochrobactrum sp. Kaboul]RAL94824.1 hypothetical protein DOU54_26350 [Agrobacterium sp. MS2]UZD72210.1 hypothetical protein LJ361_23155 [Brucella sp. JSBI001]
MTDHNRYAVRPMTEGQSREAQEDLTLIIRGEDRDLPWGRLRLLLDHELVEIAYPVIAQGSVRSLNPTDKGLAFLER